MVCTFFLCSKRVTAKLFPEIHHTLSRHKPLSAKYTLAFNKQTQDLTHWSGCIHQNNPYNTLMQVGFKHKHFLLASEHRLSLRQKVLVYQLRLSEMSSCSCFVS